MSLATPRKTAVRRQATKEMALKAIQKAVVGGRICFTWRVVAASDETKDEGWQTWKGGIVELHRGTLDDDDITGLLVKYDEDCEDLEQTFQVFPPTPDLLEVTDIFQVKDVVISQPPAKTRRLAQPRLDISPAIAALAEELSQPAPHRQKQSTNIGSDEQRKRLREDTTGLPPRPPTPTLARKRSRDDLPPQEGAPPLWFVEFAKQQAQINASLLGRSQHAEDVDTADDEDDFDDESSEDARPKEKISAKRVLTATRVAKARAKTLFVAPGGDPEEGILVPKAIPPADDILYPHTLIGMVRRKGASEAYNLVDSRILRLREGLTISSTGSDILRLLMLQLRCFLQAASVTTDSEEMQLLGFTIISGIIAQLHIPAGVEATQAFVDLAEVQLTKKTLDVAATGFKPVRKPQRNEDHGHKRQSSRPKRTPLKEKAATHKRSFRGRTRRP